MQVDTAILNSDDLGVIADISKRKRKIQLHSTCGDSRVLPPNGLSAIFIMLCSSMCGCLCLFMKWWIGEPLLVLQLDEAAPVLAGLSTPIVVAKVNADKYKKLGSKYGVE